MMFPDSHTPRWVVFLFDLGICIISVLLAYLLRFNFNLPSNELENLQFVIPFVLFVRAITFVGFRSYAGLIRYTSAKDTERIFIVLSAGSLIFVLANVVSYFVLGGTYVMPTSIVVIDFFTTAFIMSSSRLVIKSLYHEIINPSKEKTNVVIFGDGQFAAITKRTLDRDTGSKNKVVAFIDEEGTDAGKKLEGVLIYKPSDLSHVLEKFDIEKMIIARNIVDPHVKDEVVEKCLNANVKVLTVPDVNTWINGELSVNQLKNIKIDDLLERAPIKLDEKNISAQHVNQVVLVTGAAGSIGREMVIQISKYNPKKIVLFDQAESPLYDLELELKEKYNFYNFEVVIGDVTNRARVERLFDAYKPSVVYHAAAYKHVPMMENNPSEAILVNVWGTKNLSDLSVEYGVKKFVMISTDKAVNPTNVMGASKRIAEIYTQSLNKTSDTSFITTRFGNVLGSNGSVIPRFKKQIEDGGPVTVTHPEVTRYFMTIPEACQLVLEAGTMGRGGEIFVFDMGKSVKIVDLAKKMIKLSGLTIGRDIHLNFTGLRPGEKLYEELLNTKENTMPTHHSQIMIGKVREYDLNRVQADIQEMIESVSTGINFKIVGLMKKMVPEFKSKNSIYEELDHKIEKELADAGHE